MIRRPLQKLSALAIGALAMTLPAAPAVSPGIPAAERAVTARITVPLVVNLYDGSSLRAPELTDVLGRVNDIYAPARVRFTVVETDAGVAPPGDGDHLWTQPEREELRADRRGYLDHLLGRFQGVAVNFTRQPKADKPTTNGVAYGESGVVILRRHPTGLVKTAETLAHELAHTMGLGDLYDDADANRLRYGYSSTRTDVSLTDEDIRQIRAYAANRAGESWIARAAASPTTSAATSATTGVSEHESRSTSTTR